MFLEQTRSGLTSISESLGDRFSTGSIHLISGASSRAFAGAVLMPATVIKTRFESNLFKYTSVIGAIKNITQTEGLRGLFSGLGATTLRCTTRFLMMDRDAPYAGIYVYFYEQYKQWVGGNVEVSITTRNMVSGALAGVSATLLTQPFGMRVFFF